MHAPARTSLVYVVGDAEHVDFCRWRCCSFVIGCGAASSVTVAGRRQQTCASAMPTSSAMPQGTVAVM